MKVVFLNHSISVNTPLYADRGCVKKSMLTSIKKGDSANTSFWGLPAHASTHIDAPSHFISGGKSLTDFAAREWFFRRVILLKLKLGKSRLIRTSDIEAKLKGRLACDLLLIKTGSENKRQADEYWRASPGLHPELAGYLKKRFPGLRAVGMDFISVSSLLYRQEGRLAHRKFLSKGILLVEDMKLSEIGSSPKQVILSPLWLESGDGAPATVFAFL